MKVILDTNVLMSALFFRGLPRIIVDAFAEHQFQLVVSPAILGEYQRITERLSKKYPANHEEFLQFVASNSVIVSDTELEAPACEDPDDDKFIAAALESGAKIICNGDKHLLDVNGLHGIEILKPKPFADKYLKKQ